MIDTVKSYVGGLKFLHFLRPDLLKT